MPLVFLQKEKALLPHRSFSLISRLDTYYFDGQGRPFRPCVTRHLTRFILLPLLIINTVLVCYLRLLIRVGGTIQRFKLPIPLTLPVPAIAQVFC